mmetsp:Transcript_282/g.689  ORF Transcript_282/g.689 Transcript_282/m.689 type:complete len:264 (+) Transcript_282:225-1016(+)
MARRYDSSTTTFSPEGRLHQVEYAIEAINNAGTCVGILASDGIVLASERRITSPLLAPSKVSEKTYRIAGHAAACVAGLTADANILIEEARLRALRYAHQYQSSIPVEQLVSHVCNYKQAYTQFGGLRPFGVAFLFGGHDAEHGFQLYQSDPSGNYSGWKATCIGANNQAGKGLLKNEYGIGGGEGGKDGPATPPDLQTALRLAVKVLNKTMDAAATSADKFELFTMKLDKTTGLMVHHILTKVEAKEIMDAVAAEGKGSGDE